jgi:hypothetical protein
MHMQHAPVACTCREQHGIHCGDCGARARTVLQRAGRRRTVVVCLNVDGCGHQWSVESTVAAGQALQ